MSRKKKNELRVEYLGWAALNPYIANTSSARSVMFTSHFAQRLVVLNPTPKWVISGLEYQFSKSTFTIHMPCNGSILKVLHRYPVGIGKDAIPYNPETIVVYEDEDAKNSDNPSIKVGCFEITDFNSFHQYFGYPYIKTDEINKIRQGAAITKDTVFAHAPTVAPDGGYNFGTSLNVAFMSLPGVAEDGVILAKSATEKLKYYIYEKRVIEFGSKFYPLNIYGNNEEYKSFPDIGDKIREDGLLMVLREYDELLSPVEMNVNALSKQNYIFDKAVYARPGDGTIVDIKVVSNNDYRKKLPESMCSQIFKYERALKAHYEEILALEEELRRRHRAKYGESIPLEFSQHFHELLVYARKIIAPPLTIGKPNERNSTLYTVFKKAPIDEFRIEFTIRYTVKPEIGHKLTDTHGGKGVICSIWPDERMPVDKDGNRADIITDDISVVSRMNIGKLYEQYFSGACRDVTRRIKQKLNLKLEDKVSRPIFDTYDPAILDEINKEIIKLYEICSPRQYQEYLTFTPEEVQDHLFEVLNDGVRLFMPIDEQKSHVDMVDEVDREIQPIYDTVTFQDAQGNLVHTQNKVRIAPVNYILLDKIVDDGSSVSTARLQHFGILSSITKSEKFTQPYRPSPVRIMGETECRILGCYIQPIGTAELMDRNNNPQAQAEMVKNILTADKPSDIDVCVDRSKVPYGDSKPLSLLKHITGCAGFEFINVPERNNHG